MTTITLDRETADRLRTATDAVSFLDPEGLTVRTVPPADPPGLGDDDVTDAEIAEALRGVPPDAIGDDGLIGEGQWTPRDIAVALKRKRASGPGIPAEEVRRRVFGEAAP